MSCGGTHAPQLDDLFEGDGTSLFRNQLSLRTWGMRSSSAKRTGLPLVVEIVSSAELEGPVCA